MRVVKSLPTDAKPRIIALLEELLVEARRGNVTGIVVFHEDACGNYAHARDGFPDDRAVFALELTKRRLLEQYE